MCFVTSRQLTKLAQMKKAIVRFSNKFYEIPNGDKISKLIFHKKLVPVKGCSCFQADQKTLKKMLLLTSSVAVWSFLKFST